MISFNPFNISETFGRVSKIFTRSRANESSDTSVPEFSIANKSEKSWAPHSTAEVISGIFIISNEAGEFSFNCIDSRLFI